MRRSEVEGAAIGRGDVPFPTEPDQRVALLEHPEIAEIARAAGEIEAAEHAFATAVGDFEEDGSVSLGGVLRLEDFEIGGAFHFTGGVERGEFEIADDAIGGEFGFQAEVDA